MRKLKGFTLVELLIVIVIIGILMTALLPRLQGAQDIARDTARQTALSQLQAGIAGYYSLYGKWPSVVADAATPKKFTTNSLHSENKGGKLTGCVIALQQVMVDDSNLMTSLPPEPNQDNELKFNNTTCVGDYVYAILPKRGNANAGLLLVAKAETAGKANYVCGDTVTATGTLSSKNTCVIADITTGNAKPCRSITQTGGANGHYVPNGECYYKDQNELRYILTY